MSVEVLLLIVIAGLTLLAYLVAINAHGPTRLGLSYLIATIMLAGTVWVVVQHVNLGMDSKQRQRLQRLEQENSLIEQQLLDQQDDEQEVRKRAAVAAKLTAVISRASSLASDIASVDLQNRAIDFDGLVGRAVVAVRQADDVVEEFNAIKGEERYFRAATKTIDEALRTLKDAAHYYRSYYRSEDPDQEALRERIMRQKARAAKGLLDTADEQISMAR